MKCAAEPKGAAKRAPPPPQQHAEHALAAIEHGKHCLVETPFTRTLAQADAVIAAAEEHRVQVMPVYNLRFTPANETMKKFVDEGTLGPIYQVRRRHGHRNPRKGAAPPPPPDGRLRKFRAALEEIAATRAAGVR